MCLMLTVGLLIQSSNSKYELSKYYPILREFFKKVKGKQHSGKDAHLSLVDSRVRLPFYSKLTNCTPDDMTSLNLIPLLMPPAQKKKKTGITILDGRSNIMTHIQIIILNTSEYSGNI